MYFRRFRRLSIFVFCFAYFMAIGGHWVVLQGMAWTKMFVERASTTSLQVAATTTFDGHHPCKLCLKIARSSTSEKKQKSLESTKKFNFLFVKSRPSESLRFAKRSRYTTLPPSFPFLWIEKPLTPPPRYLSS